MVMKTKVDRNGHTHLTMYNQSVKWKPNLPIFLNYEKKCYIHKTCISILLVFPWQQVDHLSNQVSHSREHPCESIHVYLINLINLQLRAPFSPHQFLLEISLLAFQLRDLSSFDSLRKLQYLVLPTKWIQQLYAVLYVRTVNFVL